MKRLLILLLCILFLTSCNVEKAIIQEGANESTSKPIEILNTEPTPKSIEVQNTENNLEVTLPEDFEIYRYCTVMYSYLNYCYDQGNTKVYCDNEVIKKGQRSYNLSLKQAELAFDSC